MIPKLATWYWGGGPLSWPRLRTLETFRKYNPDWHMVIYMGRPSEGSWATAEVQDHTSYTGPCHWSRVEGLDVEIRPVADVATPRGASDVHVSDLIGWYVLAHDGGVVSDMDIVWLRPIDDLEIMQDAEAGAGLTCFGGRPKPGYIPVSFMMSSGSSAFFAQTYHRACSAYDPEVYESCGTPVLGGWEHVKAACPRLRRLPDGVVYPYFKRRKMADAIHLPGRLGDMDLNAIGLHWYAGNPLAQEANGMITEENVSRYNTIFSRALRDA